MESPTDSGGREIRLKRDQMHGEPHAMNLSEMPVANGPMMFSKLREISFCVAVAMTRRNQ